MKKGVVVEVEVGGVWVKAAVEFRITKGEPLGEYSFYREDGGGRFTACICKVREVGSAKKYCCYQMEKQLEMPDCRHHMYSARSQCPDILIVPRYDLDHLIGYGMPIKDGGNSYLTINYCPFCGHDLKDLKS
jgi:hypothetical protein